MIKALFMDYYGTVAYENGPIMLEVIQSVYKNSTAKSPEEIFIYWWKTIKEKVVHANGANFRTQHEIALENFNDLLDHFHSSKNSLELLNKMEEHWCTSALYKDARLFLEKTKLDVYFITNSDNHYVFENIKKHGLHPQGVITSEQAKYSKPRKEIFLYALEKTGLQSEEVIHIGDSLESDVKCPHQVGIDSIWMNRENKTVPDGVKSATGFDEVEKILNQLVQTNHF